MNAKTLSQFSGRLAIGTVLFCGSTLGKPGLFANESTASTGRRSRAAESVELKARRFRVVFPDGLLDRQPGLPSAADLENLTVLLAQKGGLWVPVSAADPGAPTQTITLGAGAGTQIYRGDALMAVSAVIVAELNRRGVYGVFASVDERDVARGKSGTGGDVRFVVTVAEVGAGKTSRYQLPLKQGAEAQENLAKDAGIVARSPLQAGGLLRKDDLQEYLDRLNRFSGRRVDVGVSAGEKPGSVDVNYVIREERHFFGHYQIANTGTESSGEWRSQFGGEYRHLFAGDDILRGQYATSDFAKFHAGQLSYEFALVAPDYLKGRVYGGYSHSRAQDLGVNIADFESDEGSVGAQLTWTPWYVNGWPVDFTLGAYWMNAAVNNGPAAVQSSADFFLPYVGVGTERVRETYSLLANAQVETNVAGIAGTDREDFAALGRFGADKDFTIARWNLQGSMYLEPLLFGKAWEEGKVWWKANRAHELAGSLRGQAALGGSRLVPQLLAVAGGFDTVRGYDESFTSADSVVIGSAEYRLHLARQFVKPASLVEAEKGVKQPVVADPARRGAGDVGNTFAMRPRTVASIADWDLVFRTFFDFGKTHNNDRLAGVEADHTLLGAGFGLEFQVYNPAYLTVRADLGFALKDDTQIRGREVHAGDSRLHMSVTLAW
jgi:hemolysin activation/secretion protein